MDKFSLTANFPMQMQGYAINPHFANIIKILDICENALDEREKILAVLQGFFLEPPADIELAIELFNKFLVKQKVEHADITTLGPQPSRAQEKQFCFKFDAEEIYADFVREYSIDLLSVEYLHWHKFSVLLQGLSDKSRFRQKIALRFMDLSQYKDKARADMEAAKQAVQLPVKLNKAETDYVQEMRMKLRQAKK